jgi:hypothetical protein
MTADIHVASFRNGDHICLFYRNAEEQLATAAPFVQVGLLRGERCLCVLPQERVDGLFSRLEASGIDVRKEVSRGALLMATPEESYLKGGSFDRQQMVEFLDDGMREALKLGFSGCRGTGDLSWCVSDSNTCGQMPQYEAMLDRYYPGKAALGICMYDVNCFDNEQLGRLMEAHRLALTTTSHGKRSIRIRNGGAYGDVIFDYQSPRLFHYTVQKNDAKELLNMGQELTLTAAMDAVESALRALKRASA